MDLSKLVLGAALVGLGACATVKPKCNYLQATKVCAGQYNNRDVKFYHGEIVVTPAGTFKTAPGSCSLVAGEPDGEWFMLWDDHCDGTVDAYLGNMSGKVELVLRANDEELFKKVDPMFNDTKKGLLEVDKK